MQPLDDVVPHLRHNGGRGMDAEALLEPVQERLEDVLLDPFPGVPECILDALPQTADHTASGFLDLLGEVFLDARYDPLDRTR